MCDDNNNDVLVLDRFGTTTYIFLAISLSFWSSFFLETITKGIQARVYFIMFTVTQHFVNGSSRGRLIPVYGWFLFRIDASRKSLPRSS